MDAPPLVWLQSTCGQFSLTLQGAEDAGRTCALPMMVMYSFLETAAWLQTTNFNVEMRFWTQYSSKYLGLKFGKLSKSAKCKKNRFDKGSKAMFGLMLSGRKIGQHMPDVIFWWKFRGERQWHISVFFFQTFHLITIWFYVDSWTGWWYWSYTGLIQPLQDWSLDHLTAASVSRHQWTCVITLVPNLLWRVDECGSLRSHLTYCEGLMSVGHYART